MVSVTFWRDETGTCPSFLDRLVAEPDGTRRVRPGCDELQRRSACVLKESLALAQHERTDEEQVLIDKAMLHERYEPEEASRFMAQKLGVPMLRLAISVGSLPDARDYFALFDYNVASIANALRMQKP